MKTKTLPYTVWQVGLNKGGTTALQGYFKSANTPGIHHWNIRTGHLGKLGVNQEKTQKVSNMYNFVSDMEYVNRNSCNFGYQNFKEIDEQVPGSKFILNTRNVPDWKRSTLAHSGLKTDLKKYRDRLKQCHRRGKYGDPNLPFEEAMVKRKLDHEADVKRYFKNRPNDLLVLDMDKPNQKLEKKLDKFLGLKGKLGYSNVNPSLANK